MLRDLLARTRSYRRFDHTTKVSSRQLAGLIELTRLLPSSGNLQPLKFMPVCTEEDTVKVFRCLKWARYLKDWSGPMEHERPSAYIILLNDTRIAPNAQCDAGIAGHTILMGAAEERLGGCIVASIDRDTLKAQFAIPDYLEVLYVIALGKPAERVVLETLPEGGDIRYYRTPEGEHHVPKRPLSELLLQPPGAVSEE